METNSLTAGRPRSAARAWLSTNATLPNVVTALRGLILPVLVAMYFRPNLSWTLRLSIIAALSDILDGLLSRVLKQGTAFGKIFDAILDKVSAITQKFLIFFFPVMAFPGLTTLRVVFLFTVGVEAVLAFSRNERVKKRFGFIGNDSAQWPGRCKVWCENFSIGFFLLFYMYRADVFRSGIALGWAEACFAFYVLFMILSVLYRLDKQAWKAGRTVRWCKHAFNL
jgi:phosphatidylglycerophosphate synthase